MVGDDFVECYLVEADRMFVFSEKTTVLFSLNGMTTKSHVHSSASRDEATCAGGFRVFGNGFGSNRKGAFV